jgi:hypothetical protein
MSGLTTSLNTELLQLSNEARRKHPEIKEVILHYLPPCQNDIKNMISIIW